jgi:hypothetical protein
MLLRGFHEHCIVKEVIGSRKTTVILRIQLCPSDAAIAFRVCRRRFAIKTIFAVAISKAGEQTLKREGIYPLSAVFNRGQLYVAFSGSSSFDKFTVANIEQQRQYTENEKLVTSNIVY